MKKLAAATAACALTAGTYAMVATSPAEAYAIKPTLCQIIGAGHSAPTFHLAGTHSYPVRFYVKSPGATVTGKINVRVWGVGVPSRVYTFTLGQISGVGTYQTRFPVAKPGEITVTMTYAAQGVFRACSNNPVTLKANLLQP